MGPVGDFLETTIPIKLPVFCGQYHIFFNCFNEIGHFFSNIVDG